MAGLSKKAIYALRNRLSKMGFTIIGHRLKVAEAADGELGYTYGANTVYLAFCHDYYETLSEAETISFITGTFVHENMHLLQTDLALYSRTIRSVPTFEQEFLREIYNILEDSAIEYFAPLYVSNDLVRSLNFMRATVYAKSPPLNEIRDPFLQFIAASIHFGDAGLLKGEFTFPEARACFVRCLPIMNAAVETPDNKTRAKYAKEIFELSRPLWKPHAESNEMLEKFLKELRKMLKELGKGNSEMSGSDTGPLSPTEEGDSPGENSRSRRRKITFKRISAEEFKRLMEESSEHSASMPPPDADITILIPDEPVDVESAENSPVPPPVSSEIEMVDEDMRSAEESLKEEGVVSSEDAQRILRELNAEKAEITAADKAENEDSVTSLDVTLSSDGYKKVCKGATCKNVRSRIDMSAEETLMGAYESLLTPLIPTVNKLTHQLQRILQRAAEEKSYRASGKVSIHRLSSGTKTARIFTRTKFPTRNDLHICIAIDNSGSMGGNSIDNARSAAIVLAEVFSKLGIPTSMFGFTADTHGADVYHEHFLTGRNTLRDRLRLLGIRAISNNFDGYSIRYAAAILKKKPELHKLLIVISDGCPACSAYSRADGIADTKLAIREASKQATVVGILVGRSSPEKHREMYGFNFMHIKNPRDLTTGLVRCIGNQMKEW